MHIQGYGYKIRTDHIPLRYFLTQHCETLINFEGEMDDVLEAINDIWSDNQLWKQIDAVGAIEKIIGYETILPVRYIPETDTHPGVLIILNAAPWEMSEYHRSLSQTKFETILSPYVEELHADAKLCFWDFEYTEEKEN